MKKKFKFIDHTADIKFQAFGLTLEEVFENSVLAVVETITGKEKIRQKNVKRITIEGGDNENLLYLLLEEIIYLLDAENFIVSKAKIDFDETVRSMKVEFHGDEVKNYKGLNHIKAVTYNDMFIKNLGKKWIAQVVVDV